MPYFIFSVTPDKQLTYIDNNPNYREARDQARRLRAGQEKGDPPVIKIVFAQNQNEAERLLSTTREAPVIGDD